MNIPQERAVANDLIQEATFIGMYGLAMKAGNNAITESGWTKDSPWFPCGSGNVVIKPWNSKFSRWLIENNHAHFIKGKGVIIHCPLSTQSMEPQVRWASAVAKMFREDYSIDATTWSWID